MRVAIDNKNETTLKFKKISFSPISTAILIKSSKEFHDGNLVFKDENGTVITTDSRSTTGNPSGYTTLYKFKPINKIPKKLLIEYTPKDSLKVYKSQVILK